MRILHRVLNELSFGGGAINDTLMHLANPNLPFGGVGMSGIGQYHGKYTFQTFSHSKSYIFRSTRLDSSVMYPPYKGKFKYIRTFLKLINLQKPRHFTLPWLSILLK